MNFNWLFICGRCWFLCLYPQRCGACPRTLRETAALQPPQVQLFPLRAGLIRQTGSTGGNRENHLRGLCGEGKSESAHFTRTRSTVSEAFKKPFKAGKEARHVQSGPCFYMCFVKSRQNISITKSKFSRST